MFYCPSSLKNPLLGEVENLIDKKYDENNEKRYYYFRSKTNIL